MTLWSALYQHVSNTLSRPASPRLVIAAIVLHVALALATASLTLQMYPNAGDEYAYLLSAELFSTGRLSVPSPAHRNFFDVYHVVNDGKFYGKYPPGWPVILSVGVILRIPWAVNAILGGLTLLVLYAISRRHFPPGVDTLVLVLAAANPFLVFNSASYFSHASCLLLVCWAFHALFNWIEDPGSGTAPVWLGLTSSMAFCVRPFTALAILAPACVFAFVRAWAKGGPRPAPSRILLAAAPASVCLGLFLLYNFLQTGSPLEQPFTRYSPDGGPSVPMDLTEVFRRLRNTIVLRLAQLTVWLPLSVPLAVAFAFGRHQPEGFKGRILLLASASLLVAYYFYGPHPGIQYGPRYMYEATGTLLIVSALVLRRTPRAMVAIVVVMLLLNVAVFLQQTWERSAEIRLKKNPFDLVSGMNLSRALVFIRTGVGSAQMLDLTRNGVRFDGPVLYVLDKGDRNSEIVEDFPDRIPYVYDYDQIRRTGRLRTWEPASGEAMKPGVRGTETGRGLRSIP